MAGEDGQTPPPGPSCPYCEGEQPTTVRTFHIPQAPVGPGSCYILRLFYCPRVTVDLVPPKHFSHGIVRQQYIIMPCPEHWPVQQGTISPEQEGQVT